MFISIQFKPLVSKKTLHIVNGERPFICFSYAFKRVPIDFPNAMLAYSIWLLVTIVVQFPVTISISQRVGSSRFGSHNHVNLEPSYYGIWVPSHIISEQLGLIEWCDTCWESNKIVSKELVTFVLLQKKSFSSWTLLIRIYFSSQSTGKFLVFICRSIEEPKPAQ